MRTAAISLLALSLAIPLFAGALALEILNPAGNAETQAKHLAVLARTTACHSPDKTHITAVAEGTVNGEHRTMALPVVALASPGTLGSRAPGRIRVAG